MALVACASCVDGFQGVIPPLEHVQDMQSVCNQYSPFQVTEVPEYTAHDFNACFMLGFHDLGLLQRVELLCRETHMARICKPSGGILGSSLRQATDKTSSLLHT